MLADTLLQPLKQLIDFLLFLCILVSIDFIISAGLHLTHHGTVYIIMHVMLNISYFSSHHMHHIMHLIMPHSLVRVCSILWPVSKKNHNFHKMASYFKSGSHFFREIYALMIELGKALYQNISGHFLAIFSRFQNPTQTVFNLLALINNCHL